MRTKAFDPAVPVLVLVSLLLLLIVLPLRSSADDINSITTRGNVSAVDIVRHSGTYLYTQLWVWDYDPTSTPQQATMLRCKGNSGGSLSNCLYVSAFLACPLSHYTLTNIYDPSLTTEHWYCTPPARRDRGECVQLTSKVGVLDQFLYTVYSARDQAIMDMQALSLDVVDVQYPGAVCTSKP